MKRTKAAAVLLAATIIWLSLQASLLFRANGLLATYDLPAHLHLAAIQLRRPSGLWDDGWYAGHPTYSYPPLAHALAAKAMQVFGFEMGFKIAVAVAHVASVLGLYAAARSAGFLAPHAALAALSATLSPLLLRVFLFGQYSSMVSFLFFWGVLAAFFALLRADRPDVRTFFLAILLLGLLGSTHLLPLLILPWMLLALPMIFPVKHIIRRLALPVLVGGCLALLPSLAFLADRDHFTKTVVPHITRSAEMVRPAGLLDWILAPAGLPMVLGALTILPLLLGVRRGVWIGALASLALVGYLRPAMASLWWIASLVYVGLTVTVVGPSVHDSNQRRMGAYLAVTGLVSVWLALGPEGGLARLLPFADRLVFDRPLLFGAPFGYLALIHTLRTSIASRDRRRYYFIPYVICGLALLGFSTQRVLANYAIVPGAQGRFPQGTAIPRPVLEFLSQERGFGRVLPLGLPPIAYAIPDLTGLPLIDGLYNDARQLLPLRYSGLETLGYEKFTYPDLRYTRFFLANADAYGIRWVVTGDRHYDPAIPFELFALVGEWGDDPERSIRLYRSLSDVQPAWSGSIRRVSADIAEFAVDELGPLQTGGGVRAANRSLSRSTMHVVLHGSSVPGWATLDLILAGRGRWCNQIAFRAWSPTGASLVIKILRGERWLVARPEMPLEAESEEVAVAVDCERTSRFQIGFTGSGVHHVFMSSIRLRQVRSATVWVPFEQSGPECFRVFIPEYENKVSVGLAHFRRWRPSSATDQLFIGPNELGLLTLEGSAGTHESCLAFPSSFRATRFLLPRVYIFLLFFMLLLPPRGLPSFRSISGVVTLRLRSLRTSIGDLIRRHTMSRELAWDARAREAPEWYSAFSKSEAESDRNAIDDLKVVLDGVDSARLRTGSVLEIGCGPGRLLKAIASLVGEGHGVDISGEMVSLARVRLQGVQNISLHKNDGASLSMFPDGKFDFVFSFALFQHIPSRAGVEAYLREIYRVLKAGGEMKGQVDGRGESLIWRYLQRLVSADSWFGVLFGSDEITALVRKRGFEVVRTYRTTRGGR